MTQQDMRLATPDMEVLYRRVYWRLMPLLVACFIVAYYDRVNISFAKFQMQDELQFSDTVYGLGASLFFVGYILVEVPSNIILYRVGVRRWIARIMVCWGIASILMMFVETPLHFYVLRFIVGMMEAGFTPGVMYLLVAWFPPLRRARANSLFMSGVAISGITGAPLAGWIMTRFDGHNALSGWQWLFLLEGLPAVALGFVVYFCLANRPSEAEWLLPSESQAIEADIRESERIDLRQRSLLRAFSDPRSLYLAGIYFLILTGFGGVTFWMPQLIKNAGGLDAQSAGLITAIPWLVGGLCMLVVAANSDRTGDRKWHLALCVTISSIGYALSAAFPNHLAIAVTGLSLVTLGILCVFPVFWAVPSTFLGGVAAASGLAFINSIGNLGSVFSPTFIGWVSDQMKSTRLALIVVSGLLLIAALLIVFFWPKQDRGETVTPPGSQG